MSNPYTPPPTSGMPPQPGMAPMKPAGGTNVLAIVSAILGGVSLLLSFVAIFCCFACFAPAISIAAIICGVIGLNQIKQSQESGKELCYAGIGMGIGGIVILAIGFVLEMIFGIAGAAANPGFDGFNFEVE